MAPVLYSQSWVTFYCSKVLICPAAPNFLKVDNLINRPIISEGLQIILPSSQWCVSPFTVDWCWIQFGAHSPLSWGSLLDEKCFANRPRVPVNYLSRASASNLASRGCRGDRLCRASLLLVRPSVPTKKVHCKGQSPIAGTQVRSERKGWMLNMTEDSVSLWVY